MVNKKQQLHQQLNPSPKIKILQDCEEYIQAKQYRWVAGIDEAGRGPLAGPVVAAACILPPHFFSPGLRDSKLLSALQREVLYEEIRRQSHFIYDVGIVEAEEIDRINIFQATLQAMKEAINKLKQTPDYVLVDGQHIPSLQMPAQAFIKGDRFLPPIMAAAIIAKVTRDRLMDCYHINWPEYGFLEHKGYGTQQHLQALQKFGPCPIHRKTYKPVKDVIEKLKIHYIG